MSKPLKITGDLDYLDIVVPRMMKYIERGDGIDIAHAKNHHTCFLELSTGETLRCHAYETKTMVVIDWGIK